MTPSPRAKEYFILSGWLKAFRDSLFIIFGRTISGSLCLSIIYWALPSDLYDGGTSSGCQPTTWGEWGFARPERVDHQCWCYKLALPWPHRRKNLRGSTFNPSGLSTSRTFQRPQVSGGRRLQLRPRRPQRRRSRSTRLRRQRHTSGLRKSAAVSGLHER